MAVYQILFNKTVKKAIFEFGDEISYSEELIEDTQISSAKTLVSYEDYLVVLVRDEVTGTGSINIFKADKLVESLDVGPQD
jgi:hypothetical protein